MASASAGSNALILEVLTPTNYENWRPRVETYLLAEDLWEVVEAIEPTKLTVNEAEYKAWRRKNVRALYAIQNSCGAEMFSFIREIKTAKGAWDALQQACKKVQAYDEYNADHLVRYESFIEAVSSGDWDKAEKCLGEVDIHSVLLQSFDKDGFIALHLAAWAGHVHIVKELMHLMTQEELQTRTARGHSALHLAAGEGHVHIVRELPVELMGEIKNVDGDTALHIAVQEGKIGIIKELELLMRQEDMTIRNEDGYTALHLAVNQGNVPMVKALLANKGEDEFDRYIPFTTHVRNGDWEKANEFLKELNDPCTAITTRDPRNYRMTALHIAATEGHVDIIKQLIMLLKRRQEELELKTTEDFVTFGLGVNSDVSEGVVMEKANYMVEQYEKTLGSVLEIQTESNATALFLAVEKGHMGIVKELAPLMRREGLEIKNSEGSNALHVAVMNDGHMHIVKELMSFMRPEALEDKDGQGYTTLSRALEIHKDEYVMELAKYMAEKNIEVFGIPAPPDDDIPIVEALRWSQWELARYLYSVTPLEVLKGPSGSAVICHCLTTSKMIDLAWDLLQRYPYLAMTVFGRDKTSPMLRLARMPFAFSSGTQLTRLQRWIYKRIHIREIAQVNIHDISISVAESNDHYNQRNFISSAMNLFRTFAKGLFKVCGIHHIYEIKSTHELVFKFLHCMGKATTTDNLTPNQLDTVKKSIFSAIEQGHFEFVTELCKANPILLETTDEQGRNIFHFAIQNRQKEVYSLIYEIKEEKRIEIGLDLVNSDNSMLHFAANLFSISYFDHIQDPSWLIQRELQWFKEVESVVPLEMHEYQNRSNNLTARELFTKNHKMLIKEAKESMKEIAKSCTVIGALIITVMFAVAFTVPGGNDGNTGLPLFLKDKLFKVFIVSDALSLVSSTTSVITFLGILTSRCAEHDFLRYLPTMMRIGIFTLFFSISTMMIVFSSALVIMLDGEVWIFIPSILLACIPIVSFAWLWFPLLVKMFFSTDGPGRFDRRKKIKS